MHTTWFRTLAAAALAAGANLTAQTTWQQLPTVPYTFNQFWVGSFDSLRNQVHMQDPGNGGSIFDGTQWQPAPLLPLFVRKLAYDPIRDRTVAVGLFGTGSILQTWGYFGSYWLALTQSVPFPDCDALVWHDQRQTIINFSAAGLHEWNGAIWQPLAPAAGGPPRTAPHQWDLVYDGARNVLGACRCLPPSVGAVWEWTAASGWQNVVASAPIGGAVARYGFDPLRQRYVAVARPTLTDTDELWELPAGGTTWQLVGQTPTGTGDAPIVWDWGQQRSLILTWAQFGPMYGYTAANPALYHIHGGGCAILGSVFDRLRMTSPSALPYAGSPFTAEVILTQSQLGVLATGLDDQTASGTPLPLSLAFLGMGNCLLRVSPDLLVTMVPAGVNTLRATLQIPAGGAFLGLPFFQQALLLEPGVNPFGAVMSNSMRGVIGLP